MFQIEGDLSQSSRRYFAIATFPTAKMIGPHPQRHEVEFDKR